MKAWLCRRIGHRFDSDALEYVGSYGYHCLRCGHESLYEDLPRWLERIRAVRWRLTQTWWRLRTWLAPCPVTDCGKRFGGHTDDCIPF